MRCQQSKYQLRAFRFVCLLSKSQGNPVYHYRAESPLGHEPPVKTIGTGRMTPYTWDSMEPILDRNDYRIWLVDMDEYMSPLCLVIAATDDSYFHQFYMRGGLLHELQYAISPVNNYNNLWHQYIWSI